MDVYKEFTGAISEVLEKACKDRERQQRAATALMAWLSETARKRPVPDLQDKMEAMQERVERLVENVKIEIEGGRLVVKAAGSDSDTLKAFQFGTSWFEPCPTVTELIVSTLLTEDENNRADR